MTEVSSQSLGFLSPKPLQCNYITWKPRVAIFGTLGTSKQWDHEGVGENHWRSWGILFFCVFFVWLLTWHAGVFVFCFLFVFFFWNIIYLVLKIGSFFFGSLVGGAPDTFGGEAWSALEDRPDFFFFGWVRLVFNGFTQRLYCKKSGKEAGEWKSSDLPYCTIWKKEYSSLSSHLYQQNYMLKLIHMNWDSAQDPPFFFQRHFSTPSKEWSCQEMSVIFQEISNSL